MASGAGLDEGPFGASGLSVEQARGAGGSRAGAVARGRAWRRWRGGWWGLGGLLEAFGLVGALVEDGALGAGLGDQAGFMQDR
ncbi:hypothetical protein Aglo01_54560 [Actinokineospora globicatena]|nr:hypothetical protein Aglo01_54560 [Actinokineospora globicatena]GLW88168.1 hypothetical protein Aglo02_58070 [Actinokineospora globicatena]